MSDWIRKIKCNLGFHYFNEIRFNYDKPGIIKNLLVCKYCNFYKDAGDQMISEDVQKYMAANVSGFIADGEIMGKVVVEVKE